MWPGKGTLGILNVPRFVNLQIASATKLSGHTWHGEHFFIGVWSPSERKHLLLEPAPFIWYIWDKRCRKQQWCLGVVVLKARLANVERKTLTFSSTFYAVSTNIDWCIGIASRLWNLLLPFYAMEHKKQKHNTQSTTAITGDIVLCYARFSSKHCASSIGSGCHRWYKKI